MTRGLGILSEAMAAWIKRCSINCRGGITMTVAIDTATAMGTIGIVGIGFPSWDDDCWWVGSSLWQISSNLNSSLNAAAWCGSLLSLSNDCGVDHFWQNLGWKSVMDPKAVSSQQNICDHWQPQGHNKQEPTTLTLSYGFNKHHCMGKEEFH
jgi:hypothetical protein